MLHIFRKNKEKMLLDMKNLTINEDLESFQLEKIFMMRLKIFIINEV